jgi:phytoene dehydrogenase-like protein
MTGRRSRRSTRATACRRRCRRRGWREPLPHLRRRQARSGYATSGIPGRRFSRRTSPSPRSRPRSPRPAPPAHRAHRRVRAPHGAGDGVKTPFFDPESESASRERSLLRRHRRRRRPQRARLRRLSRQGGAQGAGARAPPRGRRRRGHRGDLPGLHVLGAARTSSACSGRGSSATSSCRARPRDLPLECSFSPAPTAATALRWPDAERTRSEIARSRPATPRSTRVRAAMAELARLVKPIIDGPRPIRPRSPGELLRMLRLARPARARRASGWLELVKMMTMSAVDFLDEWFESDVLKAPMSVSGIIGTFLGVRSPGTAYVLLHHYMGEIDGALPGLGAAQGRHRRGEPRHRRLGRGAGARFAPKRRWRASCWRGRGARRGARRRRRDPRQGGGLGRRSAPHLLGSSAKRAPRPDEFVADLGAIKPARQLGQGQPRARRLPEFTCRPATAPPARRHRHRARAIDYLERAYDDAKYGAFSREPFIDVVIPTLTDPSMAPPGKHVMSRFVQYAPYHWPKGAEAGPISARPSATPSSTRSRVRARHSRRRSLHRQVLSPWDLEQEFGLTEGNIFHGELSLEQLAFLRPVAGWARYATPVPRLWMCGSGTHPGGGIMGAPGELCADHARQAGRLRMWRCQRYDAIVIGGGHNGLATACAARRAPDGACSCSNSAAMPSAASPRAIEFHPGYRLPGILHDDGLVSPRVAARLGLEPHGLAFVEAPAIYLAEANGRGVLLARDPARNDGELSAHDAAAYASYRAFLSRLAPVVERLMTSPPLPLSPPVSATTGRSCSRASGSGSSAAPRCSNCCAWRRCASPTSCRSASPRRSSSRAWRCRRCSAPGPGPGRPAPTPT